MMKVVETRTMALVTARGGSVGLPGKNLHMLDGKPLIGWSIKAALKAKLVDRVVMSTDCSKIAEVAREFGAEVPFLRPGELARSDSGHKGVVLHAIKWMRDEEGYLPDNLILLQPTSPLRTAGDIDGAIGMMDQPDTGGVIGVCRSTNHPLLALVKGKTGLDFLITDGPAYRRRQDLPETYHINGAIYLVDTASFLNEQTFLPDGARPYVMPMERSVDVDTEAEFRLAEFYLSEQDHG